MKWAWLTRGQQVSINALYISYLSGAITQFNDSVSFLAAINVSDVILLRRSLERHAFVVLFDRPPMFRSLKNDERVVKKVIRQLKFSKNVEIFIPTFLTKAIKAYERRFY